MKIFSKGHDGGKDSNVTGYWLIEIKSLFSIVLLKFNKGSREAFHSHAFNAWTWWLKGKVIEEVYTKPKSKNKGLGHIDYINWNSSLKPKYTPRKQMHKIIALEDTWALSFRGPWSKTWKEYRKKENKEVTLTHGRKIINDV